MADNPPPPPVHRFRPANHPQSNFQHMREERYGGTSQQSNYNDVPADLHRSVSPPVARRPVPGAIPASQSPVDRGMSPSPDLHPGMPALPLQSRSPYTAPSQQPYQAYQPPSGHNYAPAAAGAAAGMGVGAAAMDGRHEHSLSPFGDSGMYAHNTPPGDQLDRGYDGTGPYRNAVHSQGSYGSSDPLSLSAIPPGAQTPQYSDSSYHGYRDRSPSPSRLAAPYVDSPSGMHSRSHDDVNHMAFVDPNSIVDDGDDGLGMASSKRNSRVNLPFNRTNNSLPVAGAAAGAAAGAGAFALHNRGGLGEPGQHAGFIDPSVEKQSGWITDQKKSGTKWKKTLFIVLGIIIILGIVGGVVGGILSTRKSNSNKTVPGNGQTAADDDGKGDLSKDSPEIKKLLNNPNLHKVFSGFAYTPFAAQYPECLKYPPSQNNVTRDMAMISQLTNVIRLYGTDCNQTEMVLHAIDRLGLTDMKIWLGVWLGNNMTTNARQVNQMYTILEQSGTKYMKGVVIGNEVLFRQDLTLAQLSTYLTDAKSNMTAKGYNLPVATSDLGDNWTASLAKVVDVVMSNIHPFFGGVVIDQAAAWTYSFWQSHDVAVTAGMTGKKHIISEFGWPSAGGNDCGTLTTVCPDKTSGAVANIPNMNTLMNTWVCDALTNGTDYFW
jgi:exo-beta-1,3-glucanase (GH17 family)